MSASSNENLCLQTSIFVDADACPVKQEVMTVAERHQIRAVFVANTFLRLPRHPLFRMKLVDDKFDAADDWIAAEVTTSSVVVTSDILLAERCLSAGAMVITNNGKAFTHDNIGSAVATRALMQDLRASVGDKSNKHAGHLGGPTPFQKGDRSRFLSALHESIVAQKRREI